MFHDLLQWLQDVPGATDGDPSTSWSQQFAGSLHLWALTEGTHVMSLLLFAGTILVVDLRMLGVAFKDVPYSTLNNKVLPLTVGGFILLTVTGVLLFLSNPVHYYHSLLFRLKILFLVVAAVNIVWFHFRTQKTLAEWDARPSPPFGVKLAAGVSIPSWLLVIVFGRITALSFFECESMKPGTLGYAFAECAALMKPLETPSDSGADSQATPDQPAAADAPAAEPATPPPEPEPKPAAEPKKKEGK